MAHRHREQERQLEHRPRVDPGDGQPHLRGAVDDAVDGTGWRCRNPPRRPPLRHPQRPTGRRVRTGQAATRRRAARAGSRLGTGTTTGSPPRPRCSCWLVDLLRRVGLHTDLRDVDRVLRCVIGPPHRISRVTRRTLVTRLTRTILPVRSVRRRIRMPSPWSSGVCPALRSSAGLRSGSEPVSEPVSRSGVEPAIGVAAQGRRRRCLRRRHPPRRRRRGTLGVAGTAMIRSPESGLAKTTPIVSRPFCPHLGHRGTDHLAPLHHHEHLVVLAHHHRPRPGHRAHCSAWRP